MGRELYAGLDLGGTKIAAALLTGDGRVVGRARLNSRAGSRAEVVADTMIGAVDEALRGAGVTRAALRGAGIGAPGLLDFETGVIAFAPNLGMRDFPLRDYITDRLGVPVFLDNDVNMGTYGEYLAGAAPGGRHGPRGVPGARAGGGLAVERAGPWRARPAGPAACSGYSPAPAWAAAWS